MRDTQERVIAQLRKHVEDAGCELVLNATYGNTGFMQAVDPDKLGSDFTVHYDFQSTYCGFKKVKGTSATCDSVVPAVTGHVQYTEGELRPCVEAVGDYLLTGTVSG